MPLRFGQFQRLTLTEPVMPSSNGVNAAPGWAERTPGDTEFQVQLNNGKSHTGRTIGHVETERGLFLFPPVGDAGLVQRFFYPRGAYSRVDFGPRLGDVLVSKHTLSPQQLQDALKEQQRIRNLKLGEMLVEVDLITPAQLHQALALQSRTPMLRLGEALISLKILSPEDLAQALRSQTQNRNLPLGELLVNHGVISREELREALEAKRSHLSGDAPDDALLEPLVFESTASTPLVDLPGPAAAKASPAPASKASRPGDVLLGDLVTTPEQLHAAIEAQGRMPMVRIGEALIALGYIAESQLADALAN